MDRIDRSWTARIADALELRHFLVPRTPILSPARRRLARALTVADLRKVAARQVPRAVFDYTDGAADEEISLRRTREYLRELTFVPSSLSGLEAVDTSTTLFGAKVAQPFVLAPTGFTRMMHADGETAVVRSARRHGVAYTLSTMGTTSIEQVAAESADAPLWFQLYVSRDRETNADLLRRARAAGYGALLVTVDVPVGGQRLRDARHGFGYPPRLAAGTFLDGLRRPGWTARFLTTPPLSFASLGGSTKDLGAHMAHLFDPTMTIADLQWLRQEWDGPFVVKGVQSVADAVRFAEAGVDGIILSNHGGRQLDRSPTPVALLPEVVDAVGSRLTVGVDSGFLSGADIAAALALGADFVMLGRAYLYGLMAGGELGVDRALEILSAELVRTMKLLGVGAVDDLTPAHVRVPGTEAAARAPFRATRPRPGEHRPGGAQARRTASLR
ncbi:MAG TPA: alpha-hydroxy acid oxidase [Microbacterium sp.]|nr:alpha-hydroxy acid oxidase [Microbacterium sp.]